MDGVDYYKFNCGERLGRVPPLCFRHLIKKSHSPEYNKTSRRTYARKTKLQPINHQEGTQKNRDRLNLPPTTAPALLLPLPVPVGFEPEPVEVRVAVGLLPGLTEVSVFTAVPFASGSPVP